MPLWENSLAVFIATANHLTIYNFKVRIFIIYPVKLEKYNFVLPNFVK